MDGERPKTRSWRWDFESRNDRVLVPDRLP